MTVCLVTASPSPYSQSIWIRVSQRRSNPSWIPSRSRMPSSLQLEGSQSSVTLSDRSSGQMGEGKPQSFQWGGGMFPPPSPQLLTSHHLKESEDQDLSSAESSSMKASKRKRNSLPQSMSVPPPPPPPPRLTMSSPLDLIWNLTMRMRGQFQCFSPPVTLSQ
jgi:hypothetical protein